MNSPRTRVALASGWLAASAALLVPNLAGAQCAQDSDCGPGYECNTYTGWGGSAGRGGDGAEEPCTDPMCQSYEYEYSVCEAASCTTNADCPSNMRCYAYTYTVCDGGWAGAGGGEMIPEPSEPTCWEETSPASCAPRHTLPCSADADCGAGFSCVESIYVTCSGGGMAGGAPAGGAGGTTPTEPPPDEPYECMEVPSGSFYCELQNLPCTVDADCGPELECIDNPSRIVCGGAAGSGVGGMGGTDGAEEPPCVEGPERVCIPPGYYGPDGTGGVGAGGSTGGTGGTGGFADGGEAGSAPPSAGATGSAGMASGPGSSSGGGGGSSGGAEDDDDSGHGHGHHGRGWRRLFGCSATGSAGTQALGWMGIALAALITRRRRF